MFGCNLQSCWDDDSEFHYDPLLPQPFNLPSPLPQWPQGQGFGTGRIVLGELEVAIVSEFESIWSYIPEHKKSGSGATFYKPASVPDGFSILGHYCQPNDRQLRGYVLVARATTNDTSCNQNTIKSEFPALSKPLCYTLLWSSKSNHGGIAYIWMPNAPKGYKAMGFLVTNEPDEPCLEEIRCVRDDLTSSCEVCDEILDTVSNSSQYPLHVWTTRSCERGIFGRGVDVGTFFCSTNGDKLNIACLKNFDLNLHSMPNLDQIHALINHYGPMVYFHPDEIYLPSSVPWFFKNGALLYKAGDTDGEAIDIGGSNLPPGGKNDGKFWLDLPNDNDQKEYIKSGDLESAELYVHVKPASGGSFTDIVMWIFCPFNGPSTLKAGLLNFQLNKIGEHVGDWEHFTLRLNNFTGELWSMYFSEHSGGEWLDASDIEFFDGNKPVVYSSKCGHASFPHPGTYIQGSSKLGVGIRNDVDKSEYFVDSSTKYHIMAAEYLGDLIKEPDWLQYMREWGPTVVYDGRSELEKILNYLPFFFKFSMETLISLFPTELYGEEGPTGPKEKDNWFGDERC